MAQVFHSWQILTVKQLDRWAMERGGIKLSAGESRRGENGGKGKMSHSGMQLVDHSNSV